MLLRIKEFFRGTTCWNCKIKNSCRSYQATKFDGNTSTICNDKNHCSYCYPSSSHGSESLFKDKDTDIYIVGTLMYLLKSYENNANKFKINYCPICSKKLVEN